MSVAIDPGLRGCGVAVFDHRNELKWATYVANTERTSKGPTAWHAMGYEVQKRVSEHDQAYFEVPRIYPGMPKTDPNDLIDLAGVLGAITGYLVSAPTWCYPADWKGQVPKAMMTKRILKHLGEIEIQRIASVGALDHNTIDAIGIGLFNLKRMKRGGA